MLAQLDLFDTVFAFLCITALCIWFVVSPERSSQVLSSIRSFLGDEMGSYYLMIGLGIFLCSLYLAFSRFGQIRLGNLEKPQYSGFQWGAMMFTAGLAADILFYSCCEWMLYASDPHIAEMGAIQDWASTYPLFHWGPIPWGFYVVLSVAFGFMLHVRNREKQKYSESCRPLLGNRVDGWAGRIIDLVAVFALLAGTATTFSLATPLLSLAISRVTGIPQTTGLTILILIVVCAIYTFAVFFGMKGVQLSASCCTYLFFGLLAYVFFFGGETRFIVEAGITALGNLAQDFIGLENLLVPTDLDDLLLGLLDGMVRRSPIFHRHDQQGQNDSPNNSRRLSLRSFRHLHFLHHSGELWSRASDARKNRCADCLRLRWQPLSGDHLPAQSTSRIKICPDSARPVHGDVLLNDI